MRAAQLSRCAALLLLLGAAIATVPGRPTVMDIRSGRSPRPQSVSTASASQADPSSESYGWHGDEKEFCLLETNRRACGYAYDDYDDVITSYYYTSELSCCSGNNDYGHDSPTLNSQIRTPGSAAVGSCDWTIWYADESFGYITDYIDRMGSASAICYFGAGSDNCGGPFCDRMVMTLEGTMYYLYEAYSYWGESYTENDVCDYLDTSPRLAGNRAGGTNGTATEPRSTVGGKKSSPKSVRKDRKAAAGRRTKGAAKGPDSRAGTQYNHGDDVSQWQERKVYNGEATVINGAVTTMAGPIKDKWDSGFFEYVALFYFDEEVTDGIDSTYPWVRDKAYKFTLFKQGNYY